MVAAVSITCVVALGFFTAGRPDVGGFFAIVAGVLWLIHINRAPNPEPDALNAESPPAVPAPPASQPRQSTSPSGSAPEPALPSAPDSAHRSPAGPPQIVTRTNPGSGRPLLDPFATSDRSWEIPEVITALSHYRSGLQIRQIADAMQIDQRQVAILLVRVLLRGRGNLDDVGRAPRNGARYSPDEEVRILRMFEDGEPLEAIARREGRTQLGVGWRILDRGRVPVSEALLDPSTWRAR